MKMWCSTRLDDIFFWNLRATKLNELNSTSWKSKFYCCISVQMLSLFTSEIDISMIFVRYQPKGTLSLGSIRERKKDRVGEEEEWWYLACPKMLVIYTHLAYSDGLELGAWRLSWCDFIYSKRFNCIGSKITRKFVVRKAESVFFSTMCKC